MKMKWLILPVAGAIIYVLLFSLCQTTGSSILNFSGERMPLDWLFDALLEPSMVAYSLLPEPPANSRFEVMLFFLPSVMFYAIAFAVVIELLSRAFRRTTPSSR